MNSDVSDFVFDDINFVFLHYVGNWVKVRRLGNSKDIYKDQQCQAVLKKKKVSNGWKAKLCNAKKHQPYDSDHIKAFRKANTNNDRLHTSVYSYMKIQMWYYGLKNPNDILAKMQQEWPTLFECYEPNKETLLFYVSTNKRSIFHEKSARKRDRKKGKVHVAPNQHENLDFNDDRGTEENNKCVQYTHLNTNNQKTEMEECSSNDSERLIDANDDSYINNDDVARLRGKANKKRKLLAE